MFRLETLGQLRLLDGSGAVVLSARKELALLVFVAARSPRAASRDELQALLWGDRDETKARNSLRQALLKLRRTLGDAIETGDKVRLLPGAMAFDVRALEDAAANARFTEALGHWGGDFVPGGEALDAGDFRVWLEVERARIRKVVDRCFSQIVSQCESRGDWKEMVQWSSRWAAAFPLDEQAHSRLIDGLRLTQQIGEAVARHAEFTRRVVEELGAEPTAQWRRLGARLDEAARIAPAVAPGDASSEPTTRDGAFSRLVAAWRDAERGEKSRVLLASASVHHIQLASELVRWIRVTSPRALVLHAPAPTHGASADYAVARALLSNMHTAPGLAGAASHDLATLAELLPELREQFPSLPSQPVDADLAAALANVLSAIAEERPVALVVEDFPSADARSRDLLARLSELAGGGVLAVFSASSAALRDIDSVARFARYEFSEQSATAAPAKRTRSRAFIYTGAVVGVGAAIVLSLLAVKSKPDAVDARWVVVADVENATGDSVFDRTVSVALAAALTQSPHVRVVAPDRIGRALVRMRRPSNDPKLNQALALEVAQRDGVPIVVLPAVHGAGGAYELTTKILDATSGAVLGFAAVRADDRAHVLDALDRLGREVRRGLGETSRSIRANSVALPLATTASLDALKKFADGQRAFRMNRPEEARDLWLEAVSLDTNFALAYSRLAMVAFRDNRPTQGDSLYARAFAHFGALTERERVTIRAAAQSWRGDHAGSAALLDTYLTAYPEDLGVLGSLAYEYFRVGRLAEAAGLYNRALAIDSLDDFSWINLASVERQRDSLAAALRAYGRVSRLAPTQLTANDNANLEYAATFLLAGHADSAAGVIAALAAAPDALRRARALRSKSFLNAFAGRYAEASSNLVDAIALNRQEKQGTSEVRNRLLLATLLEERDRPLDAARQLDSAYMVVDRIDTETTLLFWVGKALARSGDTRRALLLLARVERIRHPESRTDSSALEALRGEVLLAKHDRDAALTHLERALQLNGGTVVLESVAYGAASAGQLEKAAAMYERLASKTEFGWEGQHYGRLAPYWLARVRERDAKSTLARAAYERSLRVWSHPDSTLRSVADARARLAQMARREPGG